jgi:plastocyanin
LLNLEATMGRFAALLASTLTAALLTGPWATPARADDIREFYIKTVHVDGETSTKGDANHKPEAFPEAPLPEGHGLVLSKPDEAGKWRMRAFAFEPSQIVVTAGEPIRLHFVGVQGMSHTIHVEGDGVDERFALKRGYIHTVDLTPKTAGVIEIECYDHDPSMRGEIVVLSK